MMKINPKKELTVADERVFIGDLTRKEFRERMEQGTIKAAIVPTAATEQHNEHLEMIHDTLHVTKHGIRQQSFHQNRLRRSRPA